MQAAHPVTVLTHSLGVSRYIGDKVCNNKIEKRTVRLQEQIAKKSDLPISSSFIKGAGDPRNVKM
jgi:hypothetical protein